MFSQSSSRAHALALLLAALVAACRDDLAPTDAGLSDAAPVDAPSARDAGAPLDPATYDCRAASTPPARVSPVALTCVINRSCTARLASSHRGAGAPGVLAPENSLAAIRAAVAAGADFVEGDVRVSADGVAVLMHDDTIDRTTDGTGAVASLTAAQLALRTLVVPAGADGDFACEHIPTLADALALADRRVVYILDGSKLDDPTPIVEAIRAADALTRVVYDDTSLARIRTAVTLEPRLNIALRATTPAELDSVLAAFFDHPPVYIHIEDANPAIMLPLVTSAGHRAFALGFLAEVVSARAAAGYDALYLAGVAAVQTNRIDLLGRYLGRR